MTEYRFLLVPAGRTEIWHGARRYFLLSTKEGPPRIVPGTCPHRGGPLALGHFDEGSRTWRCPWHGNGQKVTSLCRRALPAIRRGDEWLVALPLEVGRPESGPGGPGAAGSGSHADIDPISLSRRVSTADRAV
ncbi:Rieske (2Fe-2S) protein [Dongia sp.]|uniref:Rieske (2Fe-2S) protein n=1 Tax=Dongia sp. TaxID=1977262 RepID=UPI0035AE1382